MNIKYVGYARHSTSTLIFDVNQEASSRELAKDSSSVPTNLTQIFQKVRSMKLKV